MPDKPPKNPHVTTLREGLRLDQVADAAKRPPSEIAKPVHRVAPPAQD